MIELLLQDPEPWFSPEIGNNLGAYAGSTIGVLGGILGGLCGVLVPKGKGKHIVLPLMLAFAVLGVLLLLTGIVAVVLSQPFSVYFTFLLIGFILATVFGTLTPVMHKLYRVAEGRQLEADALRRS